MPQAFTAIALKDCCSQWVLSRTMVESFTLDNYQSILYVAFRLGPYF